MAKTLTVALMDPPYESETSTTAFRIITEAQNRGIKVNVFAYEGAVCLSMSTQKQHANPPKGVTDPAENDHPTTKAWTESILRKGNVEWIYCGLCADERGAEGVQVEGVRRGSPGDFLKWADGSDQTLVIATK